VVIGALRAGRGAEAGVATLVGEGSGQLLRLVREGTATTISELATAMGVSRSTVLQRADFLLRRGVLQFESTQTGARGRPPAVMRFNPRAAVVLAGQLGLTGARLAVTDLNGEVLAERFVSADFAAGAHLMLGRLMTTFDDMLAGLDGRPPVAGVGVGMPGLVELLNYSRSLGVEGGDWDTEGVVRAFWERFDAPVFVDLDVNLLALAERRKSWPDAEVFVCVKLGTLIDAAIVVNNVPVRGASNLAGGLGHVKVAASSAQCSCGSVGCLEAVASGSALVKQLAAAGFDVEQVADVVALAKQGQPEAVGAVREAGRLIGEALATVVNLLNPSVIVAWGYLTEVESPLFAGVREGLYQKALPDSSKDLVLTSAALGDLAGARGAAMLVLDEVLAPLAVDRVVRTGTWSNAWPALRPLPV
jgi:predicted NBD/HSP70 family sugar kinase